MVVKVEEKWLRRLMEVGREVSDNPATLNYLLGYIESARTMLPNKELKE